MNRRKFVSFLLGTAAASAVGLSLATIPRSDGSILRYFTAQEATGFVGSRGAFPTGNRVVRIRVFNDDQSWTNALGTYTTQDVLGLIEDLKPTTLNRYFSGPQDPRALLPARTGEPNMTVKEFLQASIDACESPTRTTMFPRLSYSQYYGDGLEANFLEAAEKMFSLCGALDPSQTLLSIDNYPIDSTTSSSSTASSNPDVGGLAEKLYEMGWTGLAWGACGSAVPEGSASYAMVCATSGGSPDRDGMSALQSIGGYGEFEVQMDFPYTMSVFASQSPDAMADALSGLAAGQAAGEYHFMYPIIQLQSAETSDSFQWDSTKIFTSPTGEYQGQSLYEVMKSLMERYNPVPSSRG